MKIMAIITLLFFTFSAWTAEKFDLCESQNDIATTIMQKRQQGVPMITMMKVASQTKEAPIRDLLISMTRAAYEYPKFSTPEHQQRQVVEFADQIYIQCLDMVMDQGANK